jgi:hypothetical protein
MSTKAINYLILGLVILSSCKKGDEDPTFSLATRTSRISGEWKLSELESRSVYNTGKENEYESVVEGNGSQLNELQIFGNDSTWIVSTINNYSMTINKDGTWSKIIDLNVKSTKRINGDFSTLITSFQKTITTNGTWEFVKSSKYQKGHDDLVRFTILNSISTDYEGITSLQYDNYEKPAKIGTSPASQKIGTEPAIIGSEMYDVVLLKSKMMKWQLPSITTFVEIDPATGSNSTHTTSIQNLTWEAK